MLLLIALACDPDGERERERILTADADADGFSIEDGDCNDALPEVHPDATEICDGLDNDCDTQTDEGTEHLWYLDNDGDGYGNPTSEVNACQQPAGYIPTGGDCDDNDPAVAPGATERCDLVDEDCDGEVDEDVETHWFRDQDEDGYGDPDEGWLGCDPPDGYVDNDFDCDDGDDRMNALATDVCDDVDNDCDGELDEDPDIPRFADVDGDGFGEATDIEYSCTPLADRVNDDTDCDDGDPAAFPGASEYCNGEDDDCDQSIDEGEAVDAVRWNLDDDGDGYGGPTQVKACDAPTGYVGDATDCDDTDAAVHPGAEEYCNDVDDDCDQDIDESGALDETTWYVDFDNDQYGDASFSLSACVAPQGYVADGTDCDDSKAQVNPGETESCDGIDNDCDGDEDEAGSIGEATWYYDADGDTWGDPGVTTTACDKPGDYVDNNDDCDDANAAVSPDAEEVCDSQDNDCDGTTDENDAVDATDWFADLDGDGYGDKGQKLVACDQPSNYVDNDQDCDDGDGSAYPGAPDTWYDGVDSDCAGDDDFDADGDGWQSDAYGGFDCDDVDNTVNPGAAEICGNGVDEDCTGVADDGCADVHCGDITANETWASGDHEVTCTVVVKGGATLTIQDGAEIAMHSGTNIEVGTVGAGELFVDGYTLGVLFTSAQSGPKAGDWGTVVLGGNTTGNTGIYGATLEYGGAPCLSDETTVSVSLYDVMVAGCSGNGVEVKGTGTPSINSAILQDNAGVGLWVEHGSGLSSFDGVVSGNASFPVSVPTPVADRLDSSTSLYTGNSDDRIELRGGTVNVGTTLPTLPLHYVMTADTTVEGSNGATLSATSTTLEMDSGVNLYVGMNQPGELYLLTATVTSAQSTKVAGDWGAVHLGTNTGSLTYLENVTLEYGGGSGANGMLACDASTGTMNNSAVNDSASYGIYTSGSCGLYLTNVSYSNNASGDTNF